MTKYAEGTEVPIERSRAEVERICKKYGADKFISGWEKDRATVMFRMKDRYIRIELPLPVLQPPETRSWYRKKELYYTQDGVDRETRRRWRCLVLYVKAKLDSVESQIVDFETAFLAHIVMPNGQTIGQACLPAVAEAYATGKDIPLLGGRT